ncbi:FxLD family lantipeptide [Haloactinospora alba]|uniref:FxLD family lantipeptide n=1 Tax=Haloactinospora alba TaxID=405555 RepID=A0A543NP19_9ACTN|nr:FxLD family lanthipeptide [Haloactinospora alba]TQN33507.1 FxLD family lantipeptide [Haloactinospora alba]
MDSPDFRDLDLDVTFLEQSVAAVELMNQTSDNCGSSNESACVGCFTE